MYLGAITELLTVAWACVKCGVQGAEKCQRIKRWEKCGPSPCKLNAQTHTERVDIPHFTPLPCTTFTTLRTLHFTRAPLASLS